MDTTKQTDAVRVRLAIGLTINQMCSVMGVDRGTLNKWENGSRQPNAAAQQLMEAMLWLHETDGKKFRAWVDRCLALDN